MAEAVEGTVKANVPARRGLSTARGTTRLKFNHTDAKPNGLFLGHLDSVDVSTIKIGEDSTGMPSFNGYEVPRIRFTFASNEDEAVKRKYVTLSFTAVESNVKTIPGGDEEWKVNQVLDWIKHILNVFVFKGRELTDDEAGLYSLSYIDYDNDGLYVPVDTEQVIASWKAFFEAVTNTLNAGKDGQSYYKTDGKPFPVWIKLIRYIKSKKNGWTPVSNGDLSFPSFVGEGCVEIYKNNTMPSIRINVINECITPKNIEKPAAKTPNVAPGMAVAPMGGMGGIDLGMGGGMEGDFNPGAVPTDMPFEN